MDIVDDVIRHLGLRSHLAYRLSSLENGEEHHTDQRLMQLHCLLEGRCWYSSGNAAEISRMAAGDVLLLPRGGRISLQHTPPLEMLSTRPASLVTPQILVLGLEVELVSGSCHPLLSDLPSVAQIEQRSFRVSGTRRHAGYLIAQTDEHKGQGESAILDRLVEILLIQAIKAHYLGERKEISYLRALQDPVISPAIRSIHQSVGYNWSLERLATVCGLSRSAFSRRFSDRVGVPAMQYLTQWRMQVALEQLRGADAKLETIAQGVGYHSSSAFQKAFKRVHGITPAKIQAQASCLAVSPTAPIR